MNEPQHGASQSIRCRDEQEDLCGGSRPQRLRPLNSVAVVGIKYGGALIFPYQFEAKYSIIFIGILEIFSLEFKRFYRVVHVINLENFRLTASNFSENLEVGDNNQTAIKKIKLKYQKNELKILQYITKGLDFNFRV